MGEKVTVRWSQNRTLHLPCGMLIPGANEVDGDAWDAATSRPGTLASQLVASGALSVERKPVATAARSEADAIELVRAVNDIHRLEVMRGSESRPAVLQAIVEQHRKLYVAPRTPGAPDPKAPPPEVSAPPVNVVPVAQVAPVAPKAEAAAAPAAADEKHDAKKGDEKHEKPARR